MHSEKKEFMFQLGQVDTRPSGYYAVPIDKTTFALQPMANVNRAIEPPMKVVMMPSTSQKPTRLMTVNATGELKMPPDQVRLVVVISSLKANLSEAKASVHKRFEYAYQTLRKHRISVCFLISNSVWKIKFNKAYENRKYKEADIYVTTSNHRKEKGNYEVVTEMRATISDFKIYETVYNILVEKLDKSVRIQAPEFFHTPSRIEALK